MFRFIAVLLISATPALSYVSNEGHEYDAACTEAGMSLSSKYPVTRIIENGAQTRHVRDIEKIQLGRDCLAQTSTFGFGKWSWANGGFRIDFPTYTIRFPRQEIYCVEGEPDPFVELQCAM